MASAEQPRSPVPPPPSSFLRLDSPTANSNSNSNSTPSLPPLRPLPSPSPSLAYATLADGIKNSPRRMPGIDTSLPLVGSSSSSIVSGADGGDDRDVTGGQHRRTGTSATPGPGGETGNGNGDGNGTDNANGGGSGSGSGSGSGDALNAQKPKKKKKKGWKGWALVLEDEEGNVIEVRDRGESPETAQRRVEDAENAKQKEGERATRAAVSRDGSMAARDGTPGVGSGSNAHAGGSRTRPRTSASPFVGGRKSSPAVATPTTAVSTAPRSRKRTTPPHHDTPVPATSTSAVPAPATAPSSARSIPDRASSDLTDEDDTEDTSYTGIALPPAKKQRKVTAGKAASTHTDSAPPSSDPVTAASAALTYSAKAASSTVPAAAPTNKAKLIHTRPSRATPTVPETRAGTSTSRTATPGPPPTAVVVMDDQPLPKVPRVGMGEVYPQPAESDIRAEANFIINAAKRKREEERVLHLRETSPAGGDRPSSQGVADLTPPPSRSGPSGTNDQPSSGVAARGTEELTGAAMGTRNGADVYTPQSAHPRRRSEAGPSSKAAYPQPTSTVASSSRVPPQSPMPPQGRGHQNGAASNGSASHPYLPPNGNPAASTLPPARTGDGFDAFEDEFDAIEQGYLTGKHATAHSTATAARVLSEHIIAPQEVALGRGPNDPVPPRFHPGQKPTVVLAPEGSRIRPRDKFDKEHADGFDGLPPQVQTDCEGFVENVRENLRNIIMYFFPQPSVRRDAFLERVGRGLTDLGWNLVDNGDLALIRRQGDGLFMPPGPAGQVPGHSGPQGPAAAGGYAGPPPRQDRR